ncbi:CBS domain-containing protein [archaeon]|jgi:CBS domain-containing protein|nr:CBS domain-containing protein [archaeon]
MTYLTVAELMTRDPIKVNPETNLLECAKEMIKKRVGSLLLVKDNKLVGFISRRDILWALIKKSKEDLETIKAIDISPKKIATIKPTATLKETMSKMKKFKFRKLPVIQNGELVGLITTKDILNFNPQFYPEIEEFNKIKEEEIKIKRIKQLKNKVYEGVCEECGNHDFLAKTHGMLICNSCRSLK